MQNNIHVSNFNSNSISVPALNKVSEGLNKEVEDTPRTENPKISVEPLEDTKVVKEEKDESCEKEATAEHSEEIKYIPGSEILRPRSKRAAKKRAKTFDYQEDDEEEADYKPKTRKAKKNVKRQRKESKVSAPTDNEDSFPSQDKSNTSGLKECKDWGKFFTAQGLGGHRAKSHPGQNQEYRDKMKIREANEEKRIVLRLAQRLYYERFSNNKIHPKNINRGSLRSLKEEISSDPMLRQRLEKENYMQFLRNKKLEFKKK